VKELLPLENGVLLIVKGKIQEVCVVWALTLGMK